MARPRLLDTYCGAGGAAKGYADAGFDVVGVDIRPQPNYPYTFILGDAIEYIEAHGREYDAIHASVPCQGYSRLRHLPWLKGREYPLLIDPTRDALVEAGRPWVIENVEDAPLGKWYPCTVLCGYALGLPLYRHRKFESSVFFLVPPHRRHPVVISPGRLLNARYSRASAGVAGVFPTAAGHTSGGSTKAVAEVMGVPWMTRDEMTQAIPPAYTRYLGEQLIRALEAPPDAR